MTYEVENKFPCPDLQPVRRRLGELGAKTEPSELQIDLYFAHPSIDYAATNEALRIRRAGPKNCFTYKGPVIDTETKTRQEIELPIESGDIGAERATALVEALGFTPVAEVRKHRSRMSLVWNEMPVEAALDEVENLGSFVEIEIVCEELELSQAQETLADLTRRLGLGPREPRSYLEMLIGKG